MSPYSLPNCVLLSVIYSFMLLMIFYMTVSSYLCTIEGLTINLCYISVASVATLTPFR
jgi:hypothetical protein